MTPFTAQFRILAVGHNSKSKSELWLYVVPSCDASKQVIRDHKGYRGSYNDRIVCVLSMSYKALHKHFLDQGIKITLSFCSSNWMTNGGIIDAFSAQAIELTVNDFKVRRSYPKYSHGYRRLTFICSIK